MYKFSVFSCRTLARPKYQTWTVWEMLFKAIGMYCTIGLVTVLCFRTLWEMWFNPPKCPNIPCSYIQCLWEPENIIRTMRNVVKNPRKIIEKCASGTQQVTKLHIWQYGSRTQQVTMKGSKILGIEKDRSRTQRVPTNGSKHIMHPERLKRNPTSNNEWIKGYYTTGRIKAKPNRWQWRGHPGGLKQNSKGDSKWV